MAPAILALSWDVGVKIRALLLSDGTLELNYRDGRSSSVPGAVILKAWRGRPRRVRVRRRAPLGRRQALRHAGGHRRGHGGQRPRQRRLPLPRLREPRGGGGVFGHLVTPTNMNQMFVSCASLETIWAESFYGSVESGTLMFSGCRAPRRGEGLRPGAGGRPPEPALRVDRRADPPRRVGGRARVVPLLPLCGRRARADGGDRARGGAGAGLVGAPVRERPVQLGGLPALVRPPARRGGGGDRLRHGGLRPREHELLALRAPVDHQCDGGWGTSTACARCSTPSTAARGSRRSTSPGSTRPRSRTSPTPSAGAGSLVTIWADADWALPTSGVSGFQTFYQCSSLVGGAGTTYASSRAGLPVHEDRRRGRRRVPHREELLTGTPPARAAPAPHVPEGVDAPPDSARDEPAVRGGAMSGALRPSTLLASPQILPTPTRVPGPRTASSSALSCLPAQSPRF